MINTSQPLIIEARGNHFRPICETSRFYAELAGTETLTLRTIGLLTRRGFRFRQPDGQALMAPTAQPAPATNILQLRATPPASPMPVVAKRGWVARMVGR